MPSTCERWHNARTIETRLADLPRSLPEPPSSEENILAAFTHRQGQFLAFIHRYCKLHRRSPAETDFREYFRLTPPSVHSMIVKLDELGLITREPRVARSIRLAIPPEEIPELEDVDGPPI